MGHIAKAGKIAAGIVVGFAVARAAARKLRKSTAGPRPSDDESAVIVSYPTMFGTANIYTICQDAHTGTNEGATNETAGQSPSESSDTKNATEAPAGAATETARVGKPNTRSNENEPSENDAVWIRVLEIDGAYQAATFIDDDHVYDPVFDYYKMYDHLFEADFAGGHGADGIPASSFGAMPAPEAADQAKASQQPANQAGIASLQPSESATATPQTAQPAGPHRQLNLLMLGGGGYAYPKHVVAHHPKARIDVVEIDPDITLLAERYFFLDRLIEEFETEKTGRLGLICDDALHYLEVCETRYDAILNDTFAGKHPVESLLEPSALKLAKTRLTPGGLYLANVISALEGPASAPLEHLVASLFRVFAHVYVIPCGKYPATETDNHMAIATDGEYAFKNAIPQLRPVHL